MMAGLVLAMVTVEAGLRILGVSYSILYVADEHRVQATATLGLDVHSGGGIRGSKTTRANLWISHGDLRGWLDANVDPPSFESRFCVLRGQNPKAEARNRPMLERSASELVLSTEALAAEEKRNLTGSDRAAPIYWRD